jgi:P-type conjugative transfer protein TrbG
MTRPRAPLAVGLIAAGAALPLLPVLPFGHRCAAAAAALPVTVQTPELVMALGLAPGFGLGTAPGTALGTAPGTAPGTALRTAPEMERPAAPPASPPAGGAGAAPAASAAPAAPATTAAPAAPAASGGAVADGEALARAYRRSGIASSVERETESLFPFGHVRPILRCAPLRACAVELEAGEIVLATSLGDAERWLLQAAAAGPGARTPLLVVKPVACDLSTNLVISTDRRIYEMALDSPPCRGADSGEAGFNPHLQYTGLARFYYPDDLVRRWTAQEEMARAEAARQQEGETALAPAARLPHLNFDYSWDRSRRWAWVPAHVFDDGEHTYIALPPGARLGELPLLFAVGQDGQLALLNYHLDGLTLVADRVLEHAVLVVGAARARDQRRLDIVNRSLSGSAAGR